MKRTLNALLAATLLLSFGVMPMSAEAAKKKPKPKGPRGELVSAGDTFEVTVRMKVGKKKRNVTITCLDQDPGKLNSTKNGLYFVSYAHEIKTSNKKLKKKNLTAKARKKLQNTLAHAKRMRAAGKNACKEPDFLSLRPYSGPWGEKQVRRLLEVGALGAFPRRVPEFVAAGMNATINDLLTIRPDPDADHLMYLLTCDSDPFDANRNCSRNNNINDFYMDGVISALNAQSIVSQNPVRMALREWVMDERAPGNPRVLEGCAQWMFLEHLNKVIKPFAENGDYKQYVLNYVKDPFGHAKWLSGASNHVISAGGQNTGLGNEDFSRELLELLLMGPNDKDGNPNYTDLDILKGSFILSGFAQTQVQDPYGNNFCAIGYFPHLHFSGSHTVFPGTPYEVTISDHGDSSGQVYTQELFRVKKRQISYELAKRLWRRFISTRATPSAITRLAKIIEEHDFKLYPVLAKMFASRAFYAPESAESIMKNPHTFLTTFMRMMEMPIENYNSLRSWYDGLGMLIGRPPTVFGFSYNNETLTSDVYQLERFRSPFSVMMYQDFRKLEERHNWTIHSGLIAPITRTGVPEEDVVNHFLKRLNLEHVVTPEQKAEYVKFIAHSLGNCPNANDKACFMLGTRRVKLFRDVPDLGDAEDNFYRTRLLAVMLGASRDFQTM